jgi:hypothetical protein
MSILSKSDSYNEKSNQRLFKILSIYLNIAPDYVEKKMIDEITCGNYGRERILSVPLQKNGGPSRSAVKIILNLTIKLSHLRGRFREASL